MSTDHPERRATDAMPRQFGDDTLGRIASVHPAFADAHIETIDMDAALPPGHVHDDQFRAEIPESAPAPVDREQNKARLLIARFKGSLADLECTTVTQVSISNIRRGDVVEIRTIVGNIYLRIIDRIRGLSDTTGEILCECRYDLPNQWSLAHAASVILPLCSKQHVITNPDGSQRNACRTMKMTANIDLPDQVKALLRENFFVELRIYASPQKERLRPVDVVRAVRRLAQRIRGGH